VRLVLVYRSWGYLPGAGAAERVLLEIQLAPGGSRRLGSGEPAVVPPAQEFIALGRR